MDTDLRFKEMINIGDVKNTTWELGETLTSCVAVDMILKPERYLSGPHSFIWSFLPHFPLIDYTF